MTAPFVGRFPRRRRRDTPEENARKAAQLRREAERLLELAELSPLERSLRFARGFGEGVIGMAEGAGELLDRMRPENISGMLTRLGARAVGKDIDVPTSSRERAELFLSALRGEEPGEFVTDKPLRETASEVLGAGRAGIEALQEGARAVARRDPEALGELASMILPFPLATPSRAGTGPSRALRAAEARLVRERGIPRPDLPDVSAFTRRGGVATENPAFLTPGESTVRLERRATPRPLPEKYAILTAENPGGVPGDAATNLRNMQQLRAGLRIMGHEGVPLRGAYFEGGNLLEESSLLVKNISRADAERLSRRFGQRSFITNTGYHDLERGITTPLKRVEPGVSDAPYSELPGGERVRLHFERKPLQEVINDIRADAGMTHPALPDISAVDPQRGKQLADIYENLKSTPDDPQVQAAYRQFADEIDAQSRKLKDAGYDVEYVDSDPYKNSAEMLKDLEETGTIKVLRTSESQSHPLLSAAQNDTFRWVHDVLGHGTKKVGFGPKGEELAYRSHSATLSPLAQRALATETRGQNSWFNFGPHAEKAARERPFAQQKAALWPEEYLGMYEAMPPLPETPGAVEAVAREAAQRPPELRPGEQLAGLPETGGRGFEVTGQRPTPPVPTEPTLLEMQQGVTSQALARAREQERIVGASVKGVDGKWYTGLNHGDARDKAAEAILANPESRERAMRAGSVLERGFERYFDTSTGRHLDARNPEVAQIADRAAQSKLPQEWVGGLHSSDLVQPGAVAKQPAPIEAPNILVRPGRVRLPFETWEDIMRPVIGGPIPGVGTMEQGLSFPRPGSILPDVAPGSVLGDVPQVDLPLGPEFPRRVSTQVRWQDAIRRALEDPRIEEMARRQAEQGADVWYAADPIAQSAIDVLGPGAGRAAFNEFADIMGPTSRMTAVPWNVRNASYWYHRMRTGQMPSPEELSAGAVDIPRGYVVRSQVGVNRGLADLLTHGALNPIGAPKAARYISNIRGNWSPFTLDALGAQTLQEMGLPAGQSTLVQGLYGMVESAAQRRAAELAAEGVFPRLPANRDPTAAFQSSIWPSHAEYGFRTLPHEFERALFRTGAHTGLDPQDVLGRFWRGLMPLF